MGLLDKASHAKQSPSQRILTELDTIYETVKRQGSVSISTLSVKMNIPLDKMEQWAQVLSGEGLLEMNYPLVGHPTLKLNVKTKTGPSHKMRTLMVFAIVVLLLMVGALYFLQQRLAIE